MTEDEIRAEIIKMISPQGASKAETARIIAKIMSQPGYVPGPPPSAASKKIVEELLRQPADHAAKAFAGVRSRATFVPFEPLTEEQKARIEAARNNRQEPKAPRR